MKDLIGKQTVCYFCYKKRRRADKEMTRMLKRAFDVVEFEGNWQKEGMFVFKIVAKKAKGR